MLLDQAHSLRQLVMNTGTRRAITIAVTSGKGGVGKSNIAVNLAIRLTQLGRRVVLMDADLGTANADVLCDLQPTGTIAHVAAGRRTLAETLMEAPGGFRLIPGASGLAQIAAMSEFERARLLQMVQEIEAEADLILIDTGAGVGPNVLSFAAGADEMLVVTTPEPTAITDAYAMIKTVCRQRGSANARVVVNMARDAAEGRAVFERINAVSRKFLDLELRYAGHVVADARVGQAVRKRRPFVLDSPGCDAAACIGQLAHRLDRNAAEPRGAGLLERISGWLAG